MAQTLSFAPMTLDIVGVRAGDRNSRRFTLLADGVPWDLTGAIVTAQARRTAPDTALALEAEIDLDQPAAGSFMLSWPGDEVMTLLGSSSSWSGVWDLQVQVTGGDLPVTVLAGKLSAVMDVSRP